MAMVTGELNFVKPINLTLEQLRELEEAAQFPITPDEECPELTPELIGTRFIPVNRYETKVAV